MSSSSSVDRKGTACCRAGERGHSLLLVMLVLLMISAIGVGTMQVASTETKIAGHHRELWRAHYAADGLARVTFSKIVDLSRSLGRFPTEAELELIEAPSLDGMEVSSFEVTSPENTVLEPLQTGHYQGLTAETKTFDVGLTLESADVFRGEASMNMRVLFDRISVLQFAVFYGHDLELLPVDRLTLDGRVHANGDIYIGSSTGLEIESRMTSAGDIFNGRKDLLDARPGDYVEFYNAEQRLIRMSGGLDSNSTHWGNEALERWDGNVLSKEHGVSPLNLTIADQASPRKIIEPGYDDDSPDDRATKIFYESSMNINILNGQAFDQVGNEIPLLGALDFTVIFDHREQRPMLVVELDMVKLADLPDFAEGPAVIYVGSFRPGNGIPDWSVETASAQETRGGLQAIVDANPGTPLADKIEDVVGKLDTALVECDKSPPDIPAAYGNIDGAIGDLWAAVDDGLLDDGEGAMYEAQLTPIGNCDVAGTEADWPPVWEGYSPPYAGGNTEFAVKLTNGEELSDALTVVSANPVYIHGDYNSEQKKPAAVMSDAVTILSNAWGDDDLAYSERTLADRPAVDTKVNLAVITGATQTVPGQYNGGAEGLLRFLEDWSGSEFTYEGSLVSLWYSQQAVGRWRVGFPVYEEPTWDWKFEKDLLDPDKVPPATPTVYTMRLARWSQQ